MDDLFYKLVAGLYGPAAKSMLTAWEERPRDNMLGFLKDLCQTGVHSVPLDPFESADLLEAAVRGLMYGGGATLVWFVLELLTQGPLAAWMGVVVAVCAFTASAGVTLNTPYYRINVTSVGLTILVWLTGAVPILLGSTVASKQLPLWVGLPLLLLSALALLVAWVYQTYRLVLIPRRFATYRVEILKAMYELSTHSALQEWAMRFQTYLVERVKSMSRGEEQLFMAFLEDKA